MKSSIRLKTVELPVFLALLAVLWFPLASVIGFAIDTANASENAKQFDARRLPILFIENRGQISQAVKYYAGTGIQRVYITQAGMVFDLVRSRPGSIAANDEKPMPLERLVFNMGFEDANPAPTIKGLEQKETTVNYFTGGDPSRWRTRIPTFSGILYENIYSGIDLKVYGAGVALEYEFIVAPGADANQVRLFYDGIDGLRVDREGRLVLETPFGELQEARPHVYQIIHGERHVVEGRFEIDPPRDEIASSESPRSKRGSRRYFGFTIGPHDTAYPLVIDPTLIYSTYLGGNQSDGGWGIAINDSGNAFVCGRTGSLNFPIQNGYEPDYQGGGWDAFVTQFNTSGDGVIYSTYLGGRDNDEGLGIALDSSGNVYVTGYTESDDFPTTEGAWDRSHNGGPDVFVTKFNSDGDDLIYSTYLGGSTSGSGDNALRIAVDSLGCAYVTGRTFSSDFPTSTGAFQVSKSGGTTTSDIFVTKFNAAGSDLVYSTYLGGSSTDRGRGLALDGSGNAVISGFTTSTDFPKQDPYQSSNAGGYDIVLTKLNSTGTGLIFSTYFGGTGDDLAYGLALDTSGNAYIAGSTSSDTDFPTESAYQSTYGGGDTDAFLAKFNSAADDLTYCTYLGGTGNDLSHDISLDGTSPCLTGYTTSTDFPTVNAYHENLAGGYDAFITRFNSSGQTLAYSTYMGGDNDETGIRMAVDSAGTVFVTGESGDGFPLVDPFQATYGGGSWDAFVLKYDGASATLVDLVSFEARPYRNRVVVTWETATEIDHAGFHLWRARGYPSDPERITDAPIPAEGGSTWGASYAYEDWEVRPRGTHWYWLEDISNNGEVVFHGPVSTFQVEKRFRPVR